MFLWSLLFVVISAIICAEPPPISPNPEDYEGDGIKYSAAKFPITDVWYVAKGENRKIRAFGMCMSNSGVALTYERKEPGDFFTYGPVRIGYMGNEDTRDVEITMEYNDVADMKGMRYMPYMFTSILFGSSYLSAVGQFLTDSVSFASNELDALPVSCDDYLKGEHIDYELFLEKNKTNPQGIYKKILAKEATIDPLNYLFCSKYDADSGKYISRLYYPMRYKKLTANGAAVNAARDNLAFAMLTYIVDDFINYAGSAITEKDFRISSYTATVNGGTFTNVKKSINVTFLQTYYASFWGEAHLGEEESKNLALNTITEIFYSSQYMLKAYSDQMESYGLTSKFEEYIKDDLVGRKNEFQEKIINSSQIYIVANSEKEVKFNYSSLDYISWPDYVQSNTIKDNWPKWGKDKLLLGPKEGQRMSIQFMDMIPATTVSTVKSQKERLEREGWKVSVSDSNDESKLALCMLDYIFDYDIGIDVWTIVVSSALFIAGFILVCVRQFKVEKKSKSVNVEATNAVGDETNPVDADVNVEVPNDVEEIVVATANNNDDIVVEEDNKVVEKEEVPTAAIEIEPAKNEIHIEEETPVEVRDEI